MEDPISFLKELISDCAYKGKGELIKKIDDYVASNSIINPNDFCNADKAMEMLHLGRNRAKFFYLLKKYGVKTNKINNMPIGYKIKEIIGIGKKENLGY